MKGEERRGEEREDKNCMCGENGRRYEIKIKTGNVCEYWEGKGEMRKRDLVCKRGKGEEINGKGKRWEEGKGKGGEGKERREAKYRTGRE